MKTAAASDAPLFIRPVTALMTCEVCDLTGGPFPAAEAAHLKAIHDRLHHGYARPEGAHAPAAA